MSALSEKKHQPMGGSLMTPGDVKSAFARRGIAIAEWARANGYPEKLVYRVLRSAQVPLRGKSHDIAVQLGLKSGVVRACSGALLNQPPVSQGDESPRPPRADDLSAPAKCSPARGWPTGNR